MNKLFVYVFGAFLFAMLPGLANAGEWYIATASDDSILFIDKSSVRQNGNLRTFWQHEVFKDAVNEMGIGKNDNDKILVAVDCANKTYQYQYRVYYLGDLNVHTIDNPSRFRPIVPDTFGETVFNCVCKNQYSQGPYRSVDIKGAQSVLNKRSR